MHVQFRGGNGLAAHRVQGHREYKPPFDEVVNGGPHLDWCGFGVIEGRSRFCAGLQWREVGFGLRVIARGRLCGGFGRFNSTGLAGRGTGKREAVGFHEPVRVLEHGRIRSLEDDAAKFALMMDGAEHDANLHAPKALKSLKRVGRPQRMP